MTAKESSVKSLGRVPAERPGGGAFQTPPCEGFLSFGWEQELFEARWRLLSVRPCCYSRLMICLVEGVQNYAAGLSHCFCRRGYLGGDVMVSSITHHAVLYEFMPEIFTLDCCTVPKKSKRWCTNQPSDSTPPLPFVCDACKSSCDFFCQAPIKGLQVSQYVRAV